MIKSVTQGKENEEARRASVLIIRGDHDPIVIQEEIFQDSSRALESDNVELLSCNASHELPMTHSSEIVESIGNFLLRAQDTPCRRSTKVSLCFNG